MAAEPTICFRCSIEFRNRFVGAAKLAGTSAQAVLERFACVWLQEPDILDRIEVAIEPTHAGQIPPSPNQKWHDLLDELLAADELARTVIQRTLEWGVAETKRKKRS